MDLLSKFEQIFSPPERGTARIIGERASGIVIGQTQSGAQLTLKGTAALNTMVYYDKRTSTVLGAAPDVPVSEYGI